MGRKTLGERAQNGRRAAASTHFTVGSWPKCVKQTARGPHPNPPKPHSQTAAAAVSLIDPAVAIKNMPMPTGMSMSCLSPEFRRSFRKEFYDLKNLSRRSPAFGHEKLRQTRSFACLGSLRMTFTDHYST